MKTADHHIWEDISSHAQGLLQITLRNPVYNARLALAIKLILVVLIALSAARMTWQVYAFSQEPATIKPAGAAPSTRKQESSGALAKVADLHLFGEAKPEVVAVAAPIKAPETRLKLQLNGVFSSDSPASSMAIIAEQGKKGMTYFKGDKVPGNASLHEIYQDRVILSRAGKLETLSLKRPEAKISIVKDKTSKDATIPSEAPQKSLVNNHESRPEEIQELQQIRNQLASSPSEVLKDLRLSPVETETGGELLGYRLEFADGKLLKELGLQAQDIITAVNGVPVTSTQTLMDMMNDTQSLQELNLSILREGRSQSLTVRLN
jgi:general secretion pathway protein C